MVRIGFIISGGNIGALIIRIGFIIRSGNIKP